MSFLNRALFPKASEKVQNWLNDKAPVLGKLYEISDRGLFGYLKNNSAKSVFGSDNDTSALGAVQDYASNLATTVGQENADNRQFNREEAALNRQFQSDQAELQRNWYEEMSNSAYQRATADMKAAGLNPILAYSQGGAATSSTGIAAGSAASYNATGGDTLSSILSSMADVISAVSGASASRVNTAFKLFRMAGG